MNKKIDIIPFSPVNVQMQESILSLLIDAFGDYTPYYRLALHHLATAESTFLLADDENHVVAHIQVASYIAHLHITPLRVAYLYAVATSKVYRGQGLMKYLMQYCLEKIGGEYDGAALIPTDRSLYHFYEPFGFIRMNDHITMNDPNYREIALRPDGATLSYLEAVKKMDGTAPTDEEIPKDVDWMYLPLNEVSIPKDMPLISPLC